MARMIDVEGMTLSNAIEGRLEADFQKELAGALEMVRAHSAGEDLRETDKDGHLVVELSVKVKLRINPASATAWVDGQVTGKASKRLTLRQSARLLNGSLQVDAVVPQDRILPFNAAKKGNLS